MSSLLILNPDNIPAAEAASFTVRCAARAILRDEAGYIALLHVRKHDYYKLPGGGIEGDESTEAALARECLEETGCIIEIVAKLGLIEEFRRPSLHQISTCFTARISGNKGAPTFTDKEKTDDFALLWSAPDEALSILRTCHAGNREGRDFIVPRDLRFLEEALKRA